MHLFLRAIGFADCTDEQEEKFIEAAVLKGTKESRLMTTCDEFGRTQLLIPISESTGICVYGKMSEGHMKVLYYYPILMGSSSCTNEEISIERHLDKESYEVICEDIKAGVTLMFFLQNPLEYLKFRAANKEFGDADAIGFNLHRKNLQEKTGIPGKTVVLSALSVGGMILLPSFDTSFGKREMTPREAAREAKRQNLIAAAKNGDQDAIESLTIEDLDTYTAITKRIVHEDVLSIVDTSFMPSGVECDQYAVIGEILEVEIQENAITEERIYLMKLDCNDIIFDMAVNEADVVGEPAPGRRFKGNVWLQGEVQF